MSKVISVSVPGKVHLLGEHAIVYGMPALLTSLDKYCSVSLNRRVDDKILIKTENFSKQIEISYSEIEKKFTEADSKWQEFSNSNDIQLLKSITPDILDYPQICIGQTLNFYKISQPQAGFDLIINSDIPIGSGLGSSGALAVAIAAAMTRFLNQPFDQQVINEIAYLAEQKKHGFPSGGDNSTSCFGGLVWFRKETPDLKIIQPLNISLTKELASRFIFIHTGQPQESTGEMVSLVRTLYQKQPEKVNQILNDQERLVRDLLAVIKNSDENKLIEIIHQGEQNLEKLGVVSKYVKGIIRKIEKAGAVAKICGGGGITKGTGVVLVYAKDKEEILKIVKNNSLESFSATLGVPGVK